MQGEDLVCHIYSVVALIDEVRRKGQKVLVHCTQGVSRSCSFCIAYLMLLEKISYDDGAVRARTHACTLFPSHTRSSGVGPLRPTGWQELRPGQNRPTSHPESA